MRVDGKAIYLAPLYHAEVNAADRLKVLCEYPKHINCDPDQINAFLSDYKTSSGLSLSAAQREAIRQILDASVSVLTGGPGTGKSTLVSGVIAVIEKFFPHAKIVSCAPTGKAAENMPGEASTIHRLLGIKQSGRFDRDLENIDMLFVDEASMMDLQLFANLLAMIPVKARVVLIGDCNQLPSIEPGQVLCDLVQSRYIHTVELHEVFRQKEDSQILSASDRIIKTADDEDIELDTLVKDGSDFYSIIVENNAHKITGVMIMAIEMLIENGLEAKDIQILTPQKSGELGTHQLNQLLQEKYNPQPKENTIVVDGREFRLNDRVIHIKNNYDLEVYNGTIGIITEIARTQEHVLTVTYPSGAKKYGKKELEQLQLAYALTIHKSQGSEFKAAIVLAVGKRMNRHLLYTGVTRGRDFVLQIGTHDALSARGRDESGSTRNSFLVKRLAALLAPPAEGEMEQQSLFLPADGTETDKCL